MKRILLISIILLVLGSLIFKYTYTRGVDYILIPNDSTALVINDWMNIRKFNSLFNLNYHFNDCCASTGDVLYLIKDPKNYTSITRENEDLYLFSNDRINKRFANLFNEAKNSPSHYIYVIGIPIQNNLDSVLNEFIQNGDKVLLPFDYENKLPSIDLEYEANNINLELVNDKLEEINDSLNKTLSTCNIVDLSKNVDVLGTSISKNQCTFKFHLIFSDNISLELAMNKLIDSGFKIIAHSNMDIANFWFLSVDNNIFSVESELKSRYEYIENVNFK